MDIQQALRELDILIAQRGLTYVLYTCGGAQLILLGYATRRTEDVDLIHEKIDSQLIEASNEVAQKLGIQEGWLNNNVSSLGKRLARGWKKKAIVLFDGSAVTLMGLDRLDLISSKLHAAIDRKGEDYQDLLFLKPTIAEIEIARNYVIKQRSDLETSEIFINAWIRELKNDLGYS